MRAQPNPSIHREAGADARCLNAPDNPPALLLAAACDGFEMLQMVDTCVFAIAFPNGFAIKLCHFCADT
jgi:hypothetical protein